MSPDYDSTLGPMVLLRIDRRDGTTEYEQLPALMVALMLLDVPNDWASAKVQTGSVSEWIRTL